MDTMLPLIRQLHDADGDRARARLLLAMPDTMLLKFAGTVDGACRRAGFDAGCQYVHFRIGIMRAVRGADGLPPAEMLQDFETFRAAFARFANGEGGHG